MNFELKSSDFGNPRFSDSGELPPPLRANCPPPYGRIAPPHTGGLPPPLTGELPPPLLENMFFAIWLKYEAFH